MKLEGSGKAATAVINMNLKTRRRAEKTYEALLPETKSKSTSRSSVNLKLEGDSVILTVRASDLSALRASINSFCRWVSLLDGVLDILEGYGTHPRQVTSQLRTVSKRNAHILHCRV